jgi:hypothetical protein
MQAKAAFLPLLVANTIQQVFPPAYVIGLYCGSKEIHVRVVPGKLEKKLWQE